MLRSYDDNDVYPDCGSADIKGYLAIPIVKAAMVSESNPHSVSYTVEKTLNPKKILQGCSDEIEPKLKKAVRALKLEAKHTQISVVDQDEQLDQSGSVCSDESEVLDGDVGSVDSDSSKALVKDAGEDGNMPANSSKESGKDAAGDENMLARETDLGEDSIDIWGRRIRYKTHCIDCDRDTCRASSPSEPALMMLGSGNLETHCDEGY